MSGTVGIGKAELEQIVALSKRTRLNRTTLVTEAVKYYLRALDEGKPLIFNESTEEPTENW